MRRQETSQDRVPSHQGRQDPVAVADGGVDVGAGERGEDGAAGVVVAAEEVELKEEASTSQTWR